MPESTEPSIAELEKLSLTANLAANAAYEAVTTAEVAYKVADLKAREALTRLTKTLGLQKPGKPTA